MVTIRDVAKESGFSSTTVSIVLNNAPLARYIPVATKKRIERAAKKLGYRPNLFARSLRSKRSHTVGVMVVDMTDPFCTLVLRGIENSLYQSSFLPILTDMHNERGRFERYLEMLLDRPWKVDRRCQLAFSGHQPAFRPRKEQCSDGDYRVRTQERADEFGDRR
jgi:LacI family transcriptional regulator